MDTLTSMDLDRLTKFPTSKSCQTSDVNKRESHVRRSAKGAKASARCCHRDERMGNRYAARDMQHAHPCTTLDLFTRHVTR